MAALYKYATILASVQQALSELTQERPTGVYDSLDENAKLLGALANPLGEMLSESDVWQQLIKQFSLTGDGSRVAWDLPNDFSRFRSDTGWSHANRRPVIIINAQQWAAISSWLSQSFFVNPACRIMNDQLTFMTAPALDEEITFEYASKFWVIDGVNPNTFKTALTANADVPMFDATLFAFALKLKWLEVRGMPTGAAQADFTRRYLQLTARDSMAQMLSLNGGTFTGFRYLDAYWNSPDTGMGS